jgi:hypothetical protein
VLVATARLALFVVAVLSTISLVGDTLELV